LLSGPADFVVAKPNVSDLADLSIELRLHDSVPNVTRVKQEDLLAGTMSGAVVGDGLRVKVDGTFVIQFEPKYVRFLRVLERRGERAFWLSGARSGRQVLPLVVNGNEVPGRREMPLIDWPGHFAFGLRAARFGFVPVTEAP
jgi:hypothetical protein